MGQAVPPREVWYLVVVLAALTLATENMAFSLPVLGSVSLSYTFQYAALLFAGPLGAAAVGAMGTVTLVDIRERRSMWFAVFNGSQLVLAALLAGTLFRLLGGVPLYHAIENPVASSDFALPAAAAAVAIFLTNVLSVTVAVALARRMRVSEVWRLQHTGTYFVSFLGLALLGYVMAQLMVTADWLGIVLLSIPLVVARETFQVYQGMRDAYADTVRSLVRALEAKDPYTRGHSQRVAKYSATIARGLGLPEPSVQRLEYAALLHDIGKIAVARGTLIKAGSLTTEEFSAIREHPGAGRELLEPVEFLEGLASVVHAHHERLDGTGYPLGLTDEQIPLEARILSVADCFDAMTSNRAYRSAMRADDAKAELQRVSGTQLDGELVEVFLSALDDELLTELPIPESEVGSDG
jgi:hypothetical protein